MYSVDDKKAAISDVQRFLFVIGQKNYVSYLSIDGVYGEETKKAVRDFQELHSLKATGTVDRETFDMIYREYNEIIKSESAKKITYDIDSFPLKIGDSGESVEELNILIRRLARFYKDLPLPYGNFYSKNTEKAIEMLQRYQREEENGRITLEFFNTLRKELLNRQKFENA